MEVFPQNTLCCYTAKLPQAIQLDHEAHWEVALVEMIHPTQIKNIVENQNTVSIEVYDPEVQKAMDERSSGADFMKTTNPDTQRTTYHLKIPPGYYFSGQHLVNTLADRFNVMFEKALGTKKNCQDRVPQNSSSPPDEISGEQSLGHYILS